MSIRDGSRAAYRAVFLPEFICHRIYSAFCCEADTLSPGEKVSSDPREWKSQDKLPGGFSEWLKDVIREQEIEQRKGYLKIADDLGIPPSIPSRWLAGWGPMNEGDFEFLASKLGNVVYTYLHIPRPD